MQTRRGNLMWWQIGFFVSLILMLISAYFWIDNSISDFYSDNTYEKELSLSRAVILLDSEWKGISEQDLMNKLDSASKRYPDKEIIIFLDEENGSIFFDNLEFVIYNGKLEEIKHY